MDGKVAFITGGAQGIGRSFAEKLLANGANVFLVDILENRGLQTERELQRQFGDGRVRFHKCDISSKEQLEGAFKTAVDKFGRLDIVCNNAGINNEKAVESMLSIDLGAVIHGTLFGIQHMSPPSGNGGVIVNTASAAGLVEVPYGPVYAAVKHGVVGFSRSIGVLSRKNQNIRINCICPTFVQTEFLLKQSDLSTGKEERGDLMTNIGMMDPSEVADAFYDLIQMEDVSGATMLISPAATRILRLAKTPDEVLIASDSLED